MVVNSTDSELADSGCNKRSGKGNEKGRRSKGD